MLELMYTEDQLKAKGILKKYDYVDAFETGRKHKDTPSSFTYGCKKKLEDREPPEVDSYFLLKSRSTQKNELSMNILCSSIKKRTFVESILARSILAR